MNLRIYKPRILALDFSRGFLVIIMMIYHFFWDLGYFGYIDHSSVVSGLGLLLAQFIGASFIFLSGLSVSILFTSNSFNILVFLFKLLKLSGISLLISVVTWYMNPESFIYFGILHLLSLCYLVSYLIYQLGNRFLIYLISVAICLFWFSGLTFNLSSLWAWIGVNKEIIPSNDFYPFIPWSFFFLFGFVSSNYVLRSIEKFKIGSLDENYEKLTLELRAIAWAGRKSLLIYIFHQPLFFSLFLSFNALRSV